MKPATNLNIHTIWQQSLILGQAIAIFRQPGVEKAVYISGAASHSIRAGAEAFAFAPFGPRLKPWYISARETAEPSSSDSIIPPEKKIKSTSKKEFISLTEKIIRATQSGGFKKVVAARAVVMKKPGAFDAVSFFEKLCTAYQNTFVSMTYIPDVGLWIGASPEVLVSEAAGQLITYALAGTKDIGDRSAWVKKEKEEQSIVADYIREKLSKISTAKMSIKGPVTLEAGRLKHLLTVFTLQDKSGLWKKAVVALHPTPAVAGFPQREAVDFICREETFDRGFYAGYLGPVNHDGKTNLFVNLRCMEVTKTQVILYAGCGVTAASDAEKEWQESERKIEVLKSFL